MRAYVCIAILFMGLIGLGICETKLTPLRKMHLGGVTCPNGGSCPDENTCCKTESGYGCCAHPDAVCCSDEVHCCPSGTTCDVPNGTCNHEVEVKSVLCPDGDSTCADGQTCCLLESGHYGCCPQSNAVCCADKKHCCPEGYTCDTVKGTCSSEQFNIASWW